MRFSACIIMQRKSVYIEGMRILCIFYAERPVFDAFSGEKLRERFENLSQLLRNLSVSFQDLSVSVATNAPKCTLESFHVVEKVLLPFLNGASQNVKTILHGSLCLCIGGKTIVLSPLFGEKIRLSNRSVKTKRNAQQSESVCLYFVM